MKRGYRYVIVLCVSLALSGIPTSHWVGLSGARWIVGVPFTAAIVRQDYDGWVVNLKYTFLLFNFGICLAVYSLTAIITGRISRKKTKRAKPKGTG